MAISPIQVTRISHNMRADLVIESLRRTQRELFAAQARISSGRRFLTASEDPISAARVLDLRRARAQQDQFISNLQQGSNLLAAAENALLEINDLLLEGSAIASLTVGNLSSADEREAEAEVVKAVRDQVLSVANRSLLGRFIFGGQLTTDRPFLDALGGVAYVGDTTELITRVDEQTMSLVSTHGDTAFGGLSNSIASGLDLSPALSDTTRLDEITGVDVVAIGNGTLIFNEMGGAGTISVDLSGAETLQDAITLINDGATAGGAAFEASLGADGLVITPGSQPVSITDTEGSAIAASLGFSTVAPSSEPIVGESLLPRVTRLTAIDALAGGSGIDVDSGLIIDNGGNTATVDLSAAETVQDVINAINSAGVFVLARINDAGTGIDVFNQVSGTALSIGENGGTTAGDLGLRTLDATTPLEQLNFGEGVTVKEGVDDLRITAKDGSTIDVNLDGAETIGDVMDMMNAAATAAGVAVTTSLAETGNGILLTDNTGGTGDQNVTLLNLSTAAIDLGLTEAAIDTTGQLQGSDVNAVRTDGILDALFQLERALRDNDTQAITAAATRLDTLRNDLIRIEGIVGARSRSLQSRLAQMQDTAVSTALFLSELEDLDFAEAATDMQSAMVQLQANLQTSAGLLNISLLDFLR